VDIPPFRKGVVRSTGGLFRYTKQQNTNKQSNRAQVPGTLSHDMPLSNLQSNKAANKQNTRVVFFCFQGLHIKAFILYYFDEVKSNIFFILFPIFCLYGPVAIYVLSGVC
jgi:hypothetical protein